MSTKPSPLSSTSRTIPCNDESSRPEIDISGENESSDDSVISPMVNGFFGEKEPSALMWKRESNVVFMAVFRRYSFFAIQRIGIIFLFVLQFHSEEDVGRKIHFQNSGYVHRAVFQKCTGRQLLLRVPLLCNLLSNQVVPELLSSFSADERVCCRKDQFYLHLTEKYKTLMSMNHCLVQGHSYYPCKLLFLPKISV